jgi:Phage tail assembly chaperone protein, TAC
MLAAALRLGVAPAFFWRLSLKEWRALVAPTLDDTLTRAAFAALTQSFPDQAHD